MDGLDSERKFLLMDGWMDWNQLEGLTDGLDSDRKVL